MSCFEDTNFFTEIFFNVIIIKKTFLVGKVGKTMRLKGEAYTESLESFSDITIMLMAEIIGTTRENSQKMSDVTTDSTLTEEQIIEKLTELKSSIDSGD